MNPQTFQILAQLADLNPEAVLFDNMDCALIGLGYIANDGPVAVYSRTKIYDKLLSDGFSREDAEEYYAGKFVALRAGALTPVIIDDWQEE
jgi:hypothetical protein